MEAAWGPAHTWDGKRAVSQSDVLVVHARALWMERAAHASPPRPRRVVLCVRSTSPQLCSFLASVAPTHHPHRQGTQPLPHSCPGTCAQARVGCDRGARPLADLLSPALHLHHFSFWFTQPAEQKKLEVKQKTPSPRPAPPPLSAGLVLSSASLEISRSHHSTPSTLHLPPSPSVCPSGSTLLCPQTTHLSPHPPHRADRSLSHGRVPRQANHRQDNPLGRGQRAPLRPLIHAGMAHQHGGMCCCLRDCGSGCRASSSRLVLMHLHRPLTHTLLFTRPGLARRRGSRERLKYLCVCRLRWTRRANCLHGKVLEALAFLRV